MIYVRCEIYTNATFTNPGYITTKDPVIPEPPCRSNLWRPEAGRAAGRRGEPRRLVAEGDRARAHGRRIGSPAGVLGGSRTAGTEKPADDGGPS